MSTKARIIAFHLLNDRSGSPKVLSQLLFHWAKTGRNVHLFTNHTHDGFLSNIDGVQYHQAWYVFRSNPWFRLIYYTVSQLILMFRLSILIHKNDIVYVNTVLPFGAAIIGKIKGARVIYHIHESTISPKILKWFLLRIVKWTASEIINVSKYVQESHGLSSIPNHLVYNSIEKSYLEKVRPNKLNDVRQHVLMVCSLKKYKGVFEFIQLAQDHPMYSFRLVLNAGQDEIDIFFKGVAIPANLEPYSSQRDLHPFYQWADVIVNLSKPDEWVETFGLTIIEGMAYGLPAIVPPVGGILEVIENDVTGYAVDSRDRVALNETLRAIMGNQVNALSMAKAAKERLKLFREEEMFRAVDNIL